MLPFKLYRVYLKPHISSNVGKFSWSWILNDFVHVQIEKEQFAVLHKTSHWEVSRGFHVVVVQLVCYTAFWVSSRNAPPRDDTKNDWLWCSGRQRNVLKSVMHVQSCCFANKTIFFWRCRCRRRRRSCLSSLFAAFRRRNSGDVKCLGRVGGGGGMVTFGFTSAIRNTASIGYYLSSWYPLSTKLSFSFYNNKNCVMSPSTSSLVTTLEWCSLWVFFCYKSVYRSLALITSDQQFNAPENCSWPGPFLGLLSSFRLRKSHNMYNSSFPYCSHGFRTRDRRASSFSINGKNRIFTLKRSVNISRD